MDEELRWQETMNGVTIDCSLDVRVHPGKSNVILLTVPGVDGSADGYENKYVRIAQSATRNHATGVVRISNPFISSFHWESNIRRVLEFVRRRRLTIVGHHIVQLYVMGHSAGAAVLAQIAYEYPEISRLLLVNPAINLGLEDMLGGLTQFQGERVTLLLGGNDPSARARDAFASIESAAEVQVVVEPGADHHFSGEHFAAFIEAPERYLFSDSMPGETTEAR